MVMKYIKAVKVGDTICFQYDGGSRPGATRTVKVEYVEGLSVAGIDQDINEYRNFSVFKIVQPVRVVTEKKMVGIYFADAQQGVMDRIAEFNGEELATLYGRVMNTSAKWNQATACVEVPEPEQTFTLNGKDVTASELKKFVESL